MERLDKFLSNNSAITRSQVKLLLNQGRVTVDGVCVKDGSIKIDADSKTVCLCISFYFFCLGHNFLFYDIQIKYGFERIRKGKKDIFYRAWRD